MVLFSRARNLYLHARENVSMVKKCNVVGVEAGIKKIFRPLFLFQLK